MGNVNLWCVRDRDRRDAMGDTIGIGKVAAFEAADAKHRFAEKFGYDAERLEVVKIGSTRKDVLCKDDT